MQEVRKQQNKNKEQQDKEQEDRKGSGMAEKKRGSKKETTMRDKIKSEKRKKDSQKKESQKEKEVEDKRMEVLKDIDEAPLLKLQSDDGIVPIKEAALHLEDLDKRTSENQARMIEERLNEMASKRKKPIIVEFIKRKKKSPRIRMGHPSLFSRLHSLKSITERRKKENIEPEKR